MKLLAMSSCCCDVRLLSFLLVIALAPVSAYSTSRLEGSLVFPDGVSLVSDVTILLRKTNNRTQHTYPRPNGAFTFYNLDDGTYLLDVETLGFIFPTVKVIVANADVKATVPEMFGMQELPYPLRIGPVSSIAYYEKRQGFNILSWLKTPYGMLLGFMVFALLIMPLLKVDQEEYRQMQEERRRIMPGSSGRQ